MAIANNNEQKPLIIYTFKKLCNGEQRLAAQQYDMYIRYCSINVQKQKFVFEVMQ